MAHPVSVNSYNLNHESYDKFRPNYPDDAVRAVIEKAHLTKDSVVLDVACGTGLFTNEIVSRVNAKIYGVDSSAGMLKSFHKKFPDLPYVEAISSNIPLESGIADAIVVAQAFHWFANEDSLKEFHRLLKPGGVVVLIWNYEDFDHMDPNGWQYKTVKQIHSYDKDVPQYNHMKWPKAFENQNYFAPYQELKFPYLKPIPSREFYWEYWATRSYITALSPEEREKAHKEHTKIMDELLSPQEVSPSGEFQAKRGTHVVYARRI